MVKLLKRVLTCHRKIGEDKSREKLVEEYMHGEIDQETYQKEWHERFEIRSRTLLDAIVNEILKRG